MRVRARFTPLTLKCRQRLLNGRDTFSRIKFSGAVIDLVAEMYSTIWNVYCASDYRWLLVHYSRRLSRQAQTVRQLTFHATLQHFRLHTYNNFRMYNLV